MITTHERKILVFLGTFIVLCFSANYTTTMISSRPVAALETAVITLDALSNVVQGQDVTVTGSLIDNTTNIGIEGATITFNGTGAENLGSVLTGSNGTFSVTGASPISVGSGWTVQAHFAEDLEYAAANSNIGTYDTNGFPVPMGTAVHVDLEGFLGATVDFEEVVTGGEISVVTCTSPFSSRYLTLDSDTCLELSSTASLAADSFTNVTIPFDEAAIPSGYSVDSISMFHEDESLTLTDITAARNTTSNTVTGKVNSFGKFIVAIALHEAKPANSVRNEIFAGDGNIASIRDINNLNGANVTISLDGVEVPADSVMNITVIDQEANLDSDAINSVNASVTSTSNSEGILLELSETGSNTGIFAAQVQLSSDPLQADALYTQINDTITAYYQISDSRFQAEIDDVIEAGFAEMKDFPVNRDEVGSTFIPLGNGIDLQLVDAQLGAEGNIIVTMSYANLDISQAAFEEDLGVFERQGDPSEAFWVDITTGVDIDRKIVTGETNLLGQFVIGCCRDLGPGGAGGGPLLPGTGVVLDFIAAVVQQESADNGDDEQETRRHRSGGGHSSSGQGVQQVSDISIIEQPISLGNNVDVSFQFSENEQVTLSFENVSATGNITTSKRSLTDIPGITIEDENQLGHYSIVTGGIYYEVAGEIFDIDASILNFTGLVTVTIPYNETLVGGDESDVRILHYNSTDWKDATISVNATANTVTGKVSSLSPFVAGTIKDDTFNSAYFELNPLKKMTLESVALTSKAANSVTGQMNGNYIQTSKGEELQIVNDIRNNQRVEQRYVVITQITNSEGYTTEIDISDLGILKRGEGASIINTWTPEKAGTYQVKIYVWNELENPTALAGAATMILQIVLD